MKGFNYFLFYERQDYEQDNVYNHLEAVREGEDDPGYWAGFTTATAARSTAQDASRYYGPVVITDMYWNIVETHVAW